MKKIKVSVALLAVVFALASAFTSNGKMEQLKWLQPEISLTHGVTSGYDDFSNYDQGTILPEGSGSGEVEAVCPVDIVAEEPICAAKFDVDEVQPTPLQYRFFSE